jgi:hypothetical protein
MIDDDILMGPLVNFEFEFLLFCYARVGKTVINGRRRDFRGPSANPTAGTVTAEALSLVLVIIIHVR